MKPRLLLFFASLLFIPLSVYMALQVQQYLSRAAGVPANIVVDLTTNLGPIQPSWAALAQGGEEPPPMLLAVREKIAPLAPRYVRLDHIYDSYQIVHTEGTIVQYDFSLLDKTVDDIIAMGALPFFSLSYMPPALTNSGSVIDPPADWKQWEALVQATIEHYSGKQQRNLTGIYYEIWNEPELSQFGKWSIGGVKDYRLLYYHAAAGAAAVRDAQPFSLGGPAVGSYYPSWITGFLSYVVQNHLRLDFYSWHRYHSSVSTFASDVANTRQQLARYPGFDRLPLILSEWGINSERSAQNGSDTAAAFTLATVARIHREIAYAFQFEIKDGPPPQGGNWGLVTHERAVPALALKPRYQADLALAQLRGNELAVSGEGTYVSGIAAGLRDDVRLILTNYDPTGRNTERVPVRFTGLTSSSYRLDYTYLLDGTQGTSEVVATNGSLSHPFIMPPNSILALHLVGGDALATLVPGKSGVVGDRALVVDTTNAFSLTSPEFQLRPVGRVSLDIKLLAPAMVSSTLSLLEIPYASASGQYRLLLTKEQQGEQSGIRWGVSGPAGVDGVFVPVPGWQADAWHRLTMGWDPNGIWATVDDGPRITKALVLDARGGKTLTIDPVGAAIDNLEVVLGGQQVIQRQFDETADQ